MKKLTYYDLCNMAKRALAEEKQCIDKDDAKNALRYSRIWGRIFKAMTKPTYFFDNSKPVATIIPFDQFIKEAI